MTFQKDTQFRKFCAYGFFKNLSFFDLFIMIFLRQAGLSFLQIGSLYAVREVTINILEIPSGFIADVIGRKRMMMAAFAGYIISFVLFYFFQTYAGFLLAFFFYGIGEASRTGTHKAMILTYLTKMGWEEFKTDYYGHTRSWSQYGSALSAIIGSAIVFISGKLDLIFLASILPYAIDFLLIKSYPDWLNGNTDIGNLADLKKEIKSHFAILKNSIKKAYTLNILLNTSAYTSFYKSTKDYLQPMLVALSASLPVFTNMEQGKRVSITIGFVYFLIYLLTSKAAKTAGQIQRKSAHKSNTLNLLLFIGIGMGALAGIAFHFDFKFLAVLLFVGILIIQNLRRPVAMSYISDHFENRVMATALSAESQFETLLVAILAPAIGLIADVWGAGLAISTIGFLLAFSFVFFKAKPS